MVSLTLIGKLLLKATTTIYKVRVVLVCMIATFMFLTCSSQKRCSIAVTMPCIQLRGKDLCNYSTPRAYVLLKKCGSLNNLG